MSDGSPNRVRLGNAHCQSRELLPRLWRRSCAATHDCNGCDLIAFRVMLVRHLNATTEPAECQRDDTSRPWFAAGRGQEQLARRDIMGAPTVRVATPALCESGHDGYHQARQIVAALTCLSPKPGLLYRNLSAGWLPSAEFLVVYLLFTISDATPAAAVSRSARRGRHGHCLPAVFPSMAGLSRFHPSRLVKCALPNPVPIVSTAHLDTSSMKGICDNPCTTRRCASSRMCCDRQLREWPSSVRREG